ncbi:MAG: 16S rRNA (guanine(527)-N(7))-methyltransferase RsmG [Xanthomonadales bacterium]|nr:16S rRNA (guanine(527)-N(7))-methyltransferase RsmG [Xanthomonadales bacterium]
MSNLKERLQSGMRQLGLPLDERVDRLLIYLDLLQRWNRVYNLSAIRAADAAVVRHLLDCLAIVPFVPDGRVADLGSGAGLPGLVLAIWSPQRSVVLVESNGKKARFLRLAARELRLDGVEVIQQRAEAVELLPPCRWLTARACARLAELLHWGGRWLETDGRLLAMKGRRSDEEIAELPPGWTVHAVHRLTVPFLDEERHLIEIGRVAVAE